MAAESATLFISYDAASTWHELPDIDDGGARIGKHHEIYLSDIRRADPSKWKTVIRQPMKLKITNE